MRLSTLRAAVATALLTIGLAFAGSGVASATPPPDHKVGICHRTASDTNPYEYIEVDVASLDAHLNNLPGHPAKTNPDGSARNDYLATEASQCTQSAPSSEPSETPSSQPSSTPSPSSDPGPSDSPEPSATPTPSSSATPTPTPTLTPSSPPSSTPTAGPTGPSVTPPPTDAYGDQRTPDDGDASLNDALLWLVFLGFGYAAWKGIDKRLRR